MFQLGSQVVFGSLMGLLLRELQAKFIALRVLSLGGTPRMSRMGMSRGREAVERGEEA